MKRPIATLLALMLILLCGCGPGSSSDDDRNLVRRWIEGGCDIGEESLARTIGERGEELEPYLIEALADDSVPAPVDEERVYEQCLRAYIRLRATHLPPAADTTFRAIIAAHAAGGPCIPRRRHRRTERALIALAMAGGSRARSIITLYDEHGPAELKPIAARAMKILHRRHAP